VVALLQAGVSQQALCLIMLGAQYKHGGLLLCGLPNFLTLACCSCHRELTIKDKVTAQGELAATVEQKEEVKKQVDVRIAELLKVSLPSCRAVPCCAIVCARLCTGHRKPSTCMPA
jgi:hypothetical protein